LSANITNPNLHYHGRQSGGEVYQGQIYKVHKDETFVPAISGRILSVQQSQEALSKSVGGEMGKGQITMRLILSPDLKAVLVDDALGQVAKLITETERTR
jgi:hypothetical protein